MGDDITIGVTEIVNTIEVTAQPNDQIVDINITDNTDNVTLNITPTVVEINVNKGVTSRWGNITGTLSDQDDLQGELDLKADLVDGKVPSSQLPSYVDDIIEVANYAALPATGESGKIYVTLNNNKIYRWTGSTYVEIADSAAVWGAITGTLSDQTDLQNALNGKQDDLNGTGIVKSTSGTISYLTDNSANWDAAYNDKINSAEVTGTNTKTLTLTQQDGGTVTASWSDINSGVWGGITGTLSNQTDLQQTLNTKEGTISGGTTSQYWRGDKSWQNLNSSAIGLGNVNNTSDADKPISTATQTALDLKVPTSRTITINGFGYDLTSNVNFTIPPAAWGTITGTLSAQTDLQQTLNTKEGTISGGTTSQYWRGDKSWQNLNKTAVGLANVDNTTDLLKPISTATQTALDAKVPTSRTITINGFGYDLTSDVNFTVPSGVWGGITGALSNQTDLYQTLNTKMPADRAITINGVTQTLTQDRTWTIGTAWGGITGTLANQTDLQTALNTKVPTSRTITINGVGYDLSANVNFNIGVGVWGQITGTLSNQTDLYQTLNTKMPADRAITINGVTQSLTQDRSWTIPTIGGTGTNGYVAFWNGTSNQAGDSNFFWDNTNKRLGIGTTTPSYKLHNTGDTFSTNYLMNRGGGLWNIIPSSGANDLYFKEETGGNVRMTINASGNVGIGTTSPSYKLDVLGDIGAYANADNNGFIGTSGGTHLISLTRLSNNAKLSGYDGVVFYTNATTLSGGSERMRITSGGNVGIGIIPQWTLATYKALEIGAVGLIYARESGASTTMVVGSNLYHNGTDWKYKVAGFGSLVAQNAGNITFETAPNGTEGSTASISERMRITSGGNLLVGKTGGWTENGLQTEAGATTVGITNNSGANNLFLRKNGVAGNVIAFYYDGTSVGSIAITSSTTGYYTSSDYRLKTDLKSFNGLDLVSQIKVYDYEWKSDETRAYGVLAHELQEVIPQAVTGEKDAEQMQSVDYSKIVPILIASIQELKAEIEILKSK